VIISKVIGGLGNQMFQYAVGRAVSLRLQMELKLDIAEFEGYSRHQGFELDRVFDLKVAIASQQEVSELLGWQRSPLVRRTILKLGMSGKHGKVVNEPHFHYWKGIEKLARECYLSGYWQSERYFSSMKSVIRKDFSFIPIVDDKNREMADYIRSVNAISLHVRRGDYVASAKTNAMHGTCPLEYYQAAIDYIIQRINAPRFIIFSDDIAWVKLHLSVPASSRFVDYNQGKNSFRDMQLMSLCKHHIIANSTFSWWGAWLNAREDKIVLAPKRWFAHDDCLTHDLYPSDWIIL